MGTLSIMPFTSDLNRWLRFAFHNTPDQLIRLSGDLTNLFLLFSSILFAIVVVYSTQPGAQQGIVDEYWKRDGFCIKDADVSYWSSFDTCLYVDVLLSMILMAMYGFWKNL